MPAERGWATVTDITDLIGESRDREVRKLLGLMRTTVFEPPASLLPAVYDRLDEAGRFSRFTAPRNTRWVAVAAGAAGAVVIASRSRRLLAG